MALACLHRNVFHLCSQIQKLNNIWQYIFVNPQTKRMHTFQMYAARPWCETTLLHFLLLPVLLLLLHQTFALSWLALCLSILRMNLLTKVLTTAKWGKPFSTFSTLTGQLDVFECAIFLYRLRVVFCWHSSACSRDVPETKLLRDFIHRPKPLWDFTFCHVSASVCRAWCGYCWLARATVFCLC